ncbi:DNA polymerase III subunit chi [Sphingomonas ginkgonis]|uniref:DNA polymerase III subunit chi n=1 Tax=Sphingomonas ginkgonis TaxID=2315330 RepID=A0A3R9WQA5_9SPHN|nr:DNA polymerase III subunit chi [Sphingomonas ginkgonis]RST30804.1 DNA polymerase III subunit chi [Sphingomonas ginkgonis]
MRVDFYQLGGAALDGIVGQLATRLIEQDQRLLVVAEDDALLARLDRQLWDQGGPTAFLAHGRAGGADDAQQPVLLATTPDAANRARNLLIADGAWREAAITFDRAFYLFAADTLEGARLAWKLLAGRDEVERHFWRQDENGRWREAA